MKILIIGAGPGGYETAAEALRRGIEVTLVNDGPLGGTCLNEGCIPTKTFCASPSLQEAILRKDEVLPQLRKGIEFLLKKAENVQGRAKFLDSHTVEVNGKEYTADKIIIAAGSGSASLPVPGAELALSSREMLELKEVPKRLCIVGGGVIGLEFASIFRKFGSEVTVLEYCPGILPRFDTDIAKRLKASLARTGIAIETSAQLTSITRDGALKLNYIKKDQQCSVEADVALMAVGRKPALEGLGLDEAGIEYGKRGIKVDENMCTNVPGIYAVGDVTGGLMLAHYASAQGLKALNHICGVKDDIRLDICPAAVFTEPELATVGLSEEDCAGRGISYRVHKSQYRANGKALASGESEGYCKIISEEGSGRILGAHILGAHASDLIHEVAALMNFNASLEQAAAVIHAHPSLSEVLQAAYRS